MYRVLILVTEHYRHLIGQLRTRKNKSYHRAIIRLECTRKSCVVSAVQHLQQQRFVCTEGPGGDYFSTDVLWMYFISRPHAAAKCTSDLFSCAQGSVSCSLKPRKLQCNQAENRSWIWTTAFARLWRPAHSDHCK